MNNKLLRIVALALASLMLMFAVACTTPGGTEDESSGETTSAFVPNVNDGTAGEEEVVTYEDDDLPDDMDYQNVVTVLYWKDVEMPEFEVEGPSINGVENAIYKRNVQVATRLGLKNGLEGLEWIGIDGDGGYMSAFTEHVGNSYNSGDRTYEIIATYSRTMGLCAVEGYMVDLASIDDSYINLDKPWWPQSLVETVTIDDAIYFLSGDISTNTLHFMYAVFCNTDMITELRLENPVDLAIDGEWTLEKFMGLVEGVYEEQGDDGKPSVGDRFGFVTEQLHIDAFYQGAGFNAVEVDDEDVLVISKDFESAKLSKYVSDLTEFLMTTDVWRGQAENQFVDGNALFTNNRMYLADRRLKDVTFKYACLPTPMYNEKQDGYRTCVGNPFTLWGIMKDVENDPDMLIECTAALECFASEAYRLTTPQIFEVNMKVKYADIDNADTVQCFDLIRNGVVYDLVRIFSAALGDSIIDLFSRTVVGNSDWTSNVNANKFMFKANLEEIVGKFEDHAS